MASQVDAIASFLCRRIKPFKSAACGHDSEAASEGNNKGFKDPKGHPSRSGISRVRRLLMASEVVDIDPHNFMYTTDTDTDMDTDMDTDTASAGTLIKAISHSDDDERSKPAAAAAVSAGIVEGQSTIHKLPRLRSAYSTSSSSKAAVAADGSRTSLLEVYKHGGQVRNAVALCTASWRRNDSNTTKSIACLSDHSACYDFI